MADIIYNIPDADGENTDEGVGSEMLQDNGDHDHGGGGGGEQYEYLPPLLRLEKHAASENIFHRQLVGRLILETLPHVADCDEEVAEVMAIAHKIADDPDPPVRAELMEQVPHITMLCHEDRSRLLHVIADHLLPLVVKFLTDPDSQVRKMSHAALLVMMEERLVEQSAVEEQVCPTVVAITKTNNEGHVDYHTGAIGLMARMAPLLGGPKTEELFIPRFVELCSDPELLIRRTCAANVGDLCAVVGTEATETLLLGRYIGLCADEVWGVRKACAEVVMSVSCKCSMEMRKQALAPAFATLLYDSSRWVRASAFTSLGPFISTFAKPCITGLAYNHLRELVVVNPEGVEFRLCTSKLTDGDGTLMKTLDPKLNNGCSAASLYSWMSASFLSADGSKQMNGLEEPPISSSENPPVIKNECDTNDAQGVPTADDSTNTAGGDRLSSEVCDRSAAPVKEEGEGQVVVTESGGLTRIHVESFNTFQYWRVPIPDISLDISLEGGKTTAVHITAKMVDQATQQTYASNLDVDMDIDHDLDKLATDLEQGNSAVSHIRTSTSVTVTEATERPNNRLGPPLNRDDWWKNLFPTDGGPPTGDASELSRQWDRANGQPPPPPPLPELALPAQDIVPQVLVDKFVTMPLPGQVQAVDSDVAHHCAFSFPAVVATLGAANWPMVRDAYTTLASDMQWKVRRTIASSIHEVAFILGEELATKDLIPILNGFIKDLDEVRIGALRNLSEFLRLLRPAQRNTYLPRLQEFMLNDNEWNWRFREVLAEQLYLSVTMFAPQDVRTYIMPLGITLLLDKVAAVRHMALNLVSKMIMHISKDASLTRGVLGELATQFAHSTKWCCRQMFAYLCARMVGDRVLDDEEFARDILPHLLDLSWDKVPNVRLAVARTIASPIMDNEYFLRPDSPYTDLTLQVVKRLQQDTDRDVRHCAMAAPRITPITSPPPAPQPVEVSE